MNAFELTGWHGARAYLEQRYREETERMHAEGKRGRIRTMATHRRDAMSLHYAWCELEMEIKRCERVAK